MVVFVASASSAFACGWIDERAATTAQTGTWSEAVAYDPDNEKAALAISKVCGIINDFKRVASEAKRRKGDGPAPISNGGTKK